MRSNGAAGTTLLATDLKRSVLNTLDVGRQPNPLIYTPYGHHSSAGGLLSLLGFNGERRDPVTGHYLLGNGYRAFNPVLMRFNSPDSLSPFDEGGVNTYAYCGGDPLNREDRTGHVWNFLKPLLRAMHIIKKPNASMNVTPSSLSSGNVAQNAPVNVPASSGLQQLSAGNSSNHGVPAPAITPGSGPSNLGKIPLIQRPTDVVRKVDMGGRVIAMVPVSSTAMTDIRTLARLNPGLEIGKQSSLIRGFAQLEVLPEGEYYRFPNT
uniref:RHS repeat-associated core domain-containing protein n=1 Tax=Pseudomonas sp. MAG733B TaxID=3122079 RepID=UPI00403E529B